MNDATVRPDTPTTADPLIPHDFSGWFSRAAGIVRRSLRPLLVIMSVSAVIAAICDVVLNHTLFAPTADPAPAVETDFADRVFAQPLTYLAITAAWAVLLLSTSFLQAMAVHLAVRDADGRPATFGEAARFAAGLAAPLLAWWLVVGLLVFVGSIFLLVPGIYLGVVLLSSVTMVVIVERRGIDRCFSLIKGRFWATFGRMLLLALISVVGYLPAGLVEYAALNNPDDLLFVDLASVLTAILAIPLGVVLTAFLIVTYTELRRHENGTVTTAQLAAEMSS